MRLRRLDLTRYGRFTNRVLDFGEVRPGRPDLHIIHGPNEAGKSTLLSAWLDFLFGIPLRSPYDFLHAYAQMNIGAAVRIGDELHDLVRVKRPRGSLTDARGGAVPDAVLAAALGGLDRAAYETMFSLNVDTLVEGGDSILSSQGDLGELLFSASAGLSELSRRLEGLRDSADAFHKKRAHKTQLKQLTAELDELAEQRAGLDVQAGAFGVLRKSAVAARAAVQAALAELGDATAERDRLRGMLGALPLMGRWTEAEAELTRLSALPDAPPAWHARIQELAHEDTRLGAQADRAARQIAALDQAIADLIPDPAALAAEDRLAQVMGLRDRHATALADLPRRRDELAAAQGRIAVLAARLAQATGVPPDEAPAPPPAVVRTQLSLLLDERAALDAAAGAARAEAAAALGRLTAAGGPPPDEGAEDEATAALRAALAPLAQADPGARAAEAAEAHAAARAELAHALTALEPWRGDAHALAAVACPSPDQLAAWRRELAEAAAGAEAARRTAADRAAEALRHAAEAEGLAVTLGPADPAVTAAARAARDAAWARHRARLDAAGADAFAVALAEHDAAVAAQLGRAADLGQLAGARARAAVAATMADQAAAAAEQAQAACDAVRAAVAARIGAILPGRADADALDELAAWGPRRTAALALVQTEQARRAAHARMAEAAAAAAAALTAALTLAPGAQDEGTGGNALPEGLTLDQLAALARTRLARAERAAAGRAERRGLADELARREEARHRTEAALGDWRDRWAATAGGWLGALAEAPAPERLRPVLADLGELAEAWGQAQDLSHRITAMEDDRRRFAGAVDDLARTLALDPGEPGPRAEAAARRIEAARRTRDRLAELGADRAALGAEADELLAQRRAWQAELDAMRARLGGNDLAGVQDALARLARRDALRREAATLSQAICTAMGLSAMADAGARLAGADGDRLREDLARAEAAASAAAAALAEAQRAAFQAEHALAAVGGDDRVALIEARRRAVNLTIADGARGWLRQRGGVLAADHALRAYRDTHRSGMLSRASDVFAAMTGGVFAGLDTQPDAGGERLIARGADGATRAPGALSRGTLHQLYLALRIAGFHEYAAAHGPVPIVADDVMETFDDERTHAALIQLAEAARVGQVIYLTHHRHLCEIARAACPEAVFHELAGPAARTATAG